MLRAIPAVALVIALSACSKHGDPMPDERIACALDGAEAFTPDCGVERISEGGNLVLVVRHPDGGFRRFAVVKDGRGLVLADGADHSHTELSGDRLEIRVGQDRYRFPFTAKDGTLPPPSIPAKAEPLAESSQGTAIACAPAGAGSFSDGCTLEQARIEGETSIVLRHPDGGFRRFDVSGNSLSPSDGAEFARVTLGGGEVEITVAKDRYRFPEKLIAQAAR